MKKIKTEEIQSAIQNYLRQRNYNVPNLSQIHSSDVVNSQQQQQQQNAQAISASAENIPDDSSDNNTINNSKQIKLNENHQIQTAANRSAIGDLYTTSLNQMILNDMVLLESSISDFFAFTLTDSSTTSDHEYLNEFEILKKFVRNVKSSDNQQFEQLILPVFVYICMHLIGVGYSVKQFINKYVNENNGTDMLKSNADLVDNLLLYNDVKDLSSCPILREWKENKYKIRISNANWKRLLNFLRKSNLYLLLRIFSLNLQIMIHSEQIDETSDESKTRFVEKQEQHDDAIKVDYGAVDEQPLSEQVNVSSVLDCIQRIGSQSSRINGACYYFVDDLNDCITSANISPNLEMISCSTENSSVHLYRLYENEIGNLTTASVRNVTSRRRQSHAHPHLNLSKKSKLNSSHFINNELNHGESRQSDEMIESVEAMMMTDEAKASCSSNATTTNVNESVEKKTRYYRLFSDLYEPEERNHFQELIGGHTGVVFKSKFTHDSKYLMSCGEDGQACLWSMSTVLDDLRRQQQQQQKKPSEKAEQQGDEEDLLNGDDDGETEFDLDSFESKIRRSNMTNTSGSATATKRETNREDQYSSASLVCTYAGHLHPVWDLEIFSNLNLFATASNDKTARLWSFERVYPLRVYCGHQCDVNSVKFHPNGSYLATGSSDKTVRLWCTQSGDFLRLFSGHRSRIFSLAFSPDGLYLASAGEDRRVRLWDLRTGQLYKELKGHTDIVHALSWFFAAVVASFPTVELGLDWCDAASP